MDHLVEVLGGAGNVAANLADCFSLKTGIGGEGDGGGIDGRFAVLVRLPG